MRDDLLLGVDVGGTGAKFVATDRKGTLLAEGEAPTDPLSCAQTLRRVAAAAAGALNGAAVAADGSGWAGVGLACAGIVDPVTGWLGRSPNLPGWEETGLLAEVARVFGPIPAAVANDVNGALYGEWRLGAGRGCDSLVMIALGTGVGGGVLIAGRLVVGAHHGAGEIGHMVLDPDGPTCRCGGRGCLEAYAGSVALLQAARRVAAGSCGREFAELVRVRGEGLTTRDLAAAAAGGNPEAAALFDQAGRRLGQAVGNLVNILDPDRVIIGGGVAQAGALVLEPCRRSAPELILAKEARDIPIVAAELGPRAAAVGAALLVREKEPTA